MRAYAERRRFTPQEITWWRKASRVVESWADADDPTEVRCHEATRAVHALLNHEHLVVVDGHYSHADHSWIEILADDGERHVLDVYAVDRLPMVQFVDCFRFLPEFESYRRGEPRTDIRQDGKHANCNHRCPCNVCKQRCPNRTCRDEARRAFEEAVRRTPEECGWRREPRRSNRDRLKMGSRS